jgi:hypothetical protein
MTTPPVTRKEYWDRILKLRKETDGHFSLAQIQEVLGLTPAQVEEARKLATLEPPLDNVDVYEAGRDTIYAWTSNLMAEIYIEDGSRPAQPPRPPSDSQRLQALEQAMSAATQERAALDINDPAATVAITAKYIALNKSFRAVEASEN